MNIRCCFFFRKKGFIKFVPKSCLCICPPVTFLVIVSSPKPVDVLTSNFAGVEGTDSTRQRFVLR